jgi:hypothetical protein
VSSRTHGKEIIFADGSRSRAFFRVKKIGVLKRLRSASEERAAETKSQTVDHGGVAMQRRTFGGSEEMPSKGLYAYDVHTWATFVSPGVNVTPATRKIIETIMPYYPSTCRSITGFQDEEGQFWKVNYHSDLIDHLLDKALTLNLAAPFPSQLQATGRDRSHHLVEASRSNSSLLKFLTL